MWVVAEGGKNIRITRGKVEEEPRYSAWSPAFGRQWLARCKAECVRSVYGALFFSSSQRVARPFEARSDSISVLWACPRRFVSLFRNQNSSHSLVLRASMTASATS
jgi:hypothetical protein